MNELTEHKPACCMICDSPLFEVIEDDGGTKRFGVPLDRVVSTSIVLYSGNHTHIETCGSCSVSSENLPHIWRRILVSTWLWTDDAWRQQQGRDPYTEDQLARRDEYLKNLLNDRPLGILCTRSLREIYSG